MKVAVLGSGSWGTALTILLARNDHDVVLLGRNDEEIASLNAYRENLRYLPGFAVPRNVVFSMFDDPVLESDMLVLAVPAGAVRSVVSRVSGTHPLVVVCSKGLEASTGRLMTEVVKEALPESEVGVISGPNLAIEIARGIPTVAVAAFHSRRPAEQVRDAFSCGSFRVSIGDDVVGVELGGALKNVLAIGAGMSDGLGFGDNTKGAFLSRGLMEINRLGAAMGARAETLLGPAGVGDLFATAGSTLSRNYRLGRMLGEGFSISEAQDTIGQVAEGVPTSDAVLVLARQRNVEMPVFAAVEAVIRGRIAPRQVVGMLMERASKMDDFLG